jgi:5'-phosphate synthase pdxT subunit
MATVGVAALQGGVAEHGVMLESLGHRVAYIRSPEQLRNIDALVLPGGESTTLVLLMTRWGLFEPLRLAVSKGLPVLGTCAGAVLLAREVTEREHPLSQPSLEAADVRAERNSFGRQVASFREDLTVLGLDSPFPGVFIRAPLLHPLNPGAEVMASVSEGAVMIRQGKVWLCSFHPELTDDSRIHRIFLRESGIAWPQS